MINYSYGALYRNISCITPRNSIFLMSYGALYGVFEGNEGKTNGFPNLPKISLTLQPEKVNKQKNTRYESSNTIRRKIQESAGGLRF